MTVESARTLDVEGFAHHRGVLDPAEIARWRAFAVERCGDEGHGFHTDLERADPDERAANEVALAPLWERVLPEVLPASRVFMSSFLVKWPGPGSDLYVHQDSTYVDETRHRSCAVWVALDDADDEIGNGPLRVLPGSHRWTDELRGTRTEPWFGSLRGELFESMTSVPVAAGDVVVMDNRLIHASAPNGSDTPRIAIAGAAIPVGADLRHAVALDDGRVGLLAVDDDFYRLHSPQGLAADPPEGPFFAVLPQRTVGPDAAEVARVVGAVEIGPPGSEADEEVGSLPPSAEGTGRLLSGALGFNHRRIERASRHHPGPLHGADELPWLLDLEGAHEAIRGEWDRATDEGFHPSPIELVSGSEFGADGAWDAVVLRHNGGWIDRNAERFAQTTSVLERIPRLRAALFSVLSAGARIPPHRGANNGVLRGHLGVEIPEPQGSCRLHVGRATVSWSEGRAFAFDDSYLHSAENKAARPRTVLMIEVDRPLEGWTGLMNRSIQRAFAAHPQVRGATRRILEVDEAVNATV